MAALFCMGLEAPAVVVGMVTHLETQAAVAVLEGILVLAGAAVVSTQRLHLQQDQAAVLAAAMVAAILRAAALDYLDPAVAVVLARGLGQYTQQVAREVLMQAHPS